MGFARCSSNYHGGKFWESTLDVAPRKPESALSTCAAFAFGSPTFYGKGYLIGSGRGWHLDSSSSSSVKVKVISCDATEQKDGSRIAKPSASFKNSIQMPTAEGDFSAMTDFLVKLEEMGIDQRPLTTAAEMVGARSDVREALSRDEFDIFLDFVRRLNDAGVQPAGIIGASARALLSQHCRKMVVRGEVEECIQLLSSLSECGFDAKKLVDIRYMIKACVRRGSVDAALRYAGLLPSVNLHYNFIMHEFGQLGDVSSVYAAFSSMKKAGIKPDMYTYRSLIDACSHGSDVAKATSLFEEIVSSGAIPNVYVYNSLMNVCAADTEAVWRFYTHMQRLGVEPDRSTYNVMLKSCSLSKSFDKAISLYEDVEGSSLKLDVVTYTTTIDIFGDAKLWESALKVKENMISSGVTPNVMTWTALIGACANVGMVDQAFNLFNEMCIAGCTPNEQTYNMLIKACCRGSQHERALRLLNEWKETGRISGYRQTDDGQADLDTELSTHGRELYPNEHGHAQMLEKTRLSKPNLVTYNTLMKSCGEEVTLMEGIMEHIISVGLTPDLRSWSTLIDAYGSRGKVEEAITIFNKMRAEGIKPDLVVYTSIIKACVRGGDADRAFEYFRQLKDAGLRPNQVTYHTLFRAQRTCRKFSEVQRALALYEEMREAGYAPNDAILRVLLAQWAEGAIEVGQLTDSGTSLLNQFQDEVSVEYSKALLQKAAVHAKEPEAEPNLVIDLHGLSRGEARATVLAVLRIIKERHNQGYLVSDDLVIITGVGRRSEVPGVAVIRQTVLHVLEKELNLPVNVGSTEVFIKRKTASTTRDNGHILTRTVEAKHDPSMDGRAGSFMPPSAPMNASVNLAREKLGLDAFNVRKPRNSGRLVVSKDALQQWLLRKRSIIVGPSAGHADVIVDA